jgi:DNA-binding transcriptional regulator YiaG
MTRKVKAGARSGVLAAIHETATGLHRAGILDAATMRELHAVCLTTRRPALDRAGSHRHKSRNFGPSADDQ